MHSYPFTSAGQDTMPNTLQEVALDVISTKECASLMGSQLPKDTDKIMCALTPNKDTCQVRSTSHHAHYKQAATL